MAMVGAKEAAVEIVEVLVEGGAADAGRREYALDRQLAVAVATGKLRDGVEDALLDRPGAGYGDRA
jgi:hypothetical protein